MQSVRCVVRHLMWPALAWMLALGLLAGAAVDGSAAALPQAADTVSGVVFDDANLNGLFDTGEAGVADVPVSNGLDVVLTDADGRYTLPMLADTVYFITKPPGFMVPVDEDNLPQFYYVHYPQGSPDSIQEFRGIAPTGELPSSLDFPLQRLDEAAVDAPFTVLAIGDAQVRDYQELGYFRDDIVADIVAEDAFDAAFAVVLGDMLTDQLSIFPSFKQNMALTGLPTYYLPGNRDMNFDAVDDAHSLDTYISHFGPTYYSLDHGDVHFVMLDNVKWNGATPNRAGGNYTDGFGANTLAWLANDLATVPQDKLIVLAMHIPLVATVDAPAPMTPDGDRAALYALLDGYDVLALTGHTHVNEVHLPGDERETWGGAMPFTHITAGAACGGWWAGPEDDRGIPMAYQRDGAPNGYFVIDFQGSDFAPRYKGANLPARQQMHVALLNRWDLQLPANTVTSGELGHTQLATNVWAGSSQTEVTCRFDDGSETAGTRNPIVRDPYAVARQEELDAWMLDHRSWQNLFPPPIRAKIGAENWMQTNTSMHLWTCPLPADLEPGAHRATVMVNDAFGQTFTEPYLFDVWAME
ncbi:MAG: calcineurin-like phosphoesterase family protein [Caldilineaceae bacterium]|nr:calcineurin-like phosphoesterase family protein [Caldilineaceae bacterium]